MWVKPAFLTAMQSDGEEAVDGLEHVPETIPSARTLNRIYP
jgi:hypothetical protein